MELDFQSFTTLMLANMTAELRKSAVSLVLANRICNGRHTARHPRQCRTLISLRVGPEDAAILAKEFQPKFGTQDFLSLPNRHVYLKLMIDGSPAFSAKTLMAGAGQWRKARRFIRDYFDGYCSGPHIPSFSCAIVLYVVANAVAARSASNDAAHPYFYGA